MKTWKIALTAGGILLLFVGFVFFMGGLDAAYNKVFNPINEQTRYDTFKESKAYIDGMISEIRDKKLEYERTPVKDELGRAAIRGFILKHTASFDRKHLPADLSLFLQQLEHDAVNFGNPHQ